MNISLLLLGFLIGVRHAIEADHVAAVASLATGASSLRETVRQGAVWGLGHTVTLFIFGSIALLANGIIPDHLAAVLEFAVGIMLVFLGLDVLWRLYKKRVHFHLHAHGGGLRHIHAHSHMPADEDSNITCSQPAGRHQPGLHQHQHVKGFPRRALLVGLMHGMAGSAALILLTLQSVQTTQAGLIYILLFGIGSILGMVTLSAVIAVPLCYSSNRFTRIYTGFNVVIAVVTLAVGFTMIADYL